MPEDEEEDENGEEEPLASDRPDFVEASSNVGLGRIQLEMGYTFIQDREGGQSSRTHSHPEILLRMGIFADWLELRIGQNFGNQGLLNLEGRQGNHGAEDLYLGLGIALTEEKGWIPESRIVLQMSVPTGSSDFSDRAVLPGFNYLYGWDLVPDFMSLGGSTQANRARDEAGNFYTEWAQAFTVGISLTPKLGMYMESFGIFPNGARDDETGPQYYADGGFIYRITPNFQLDIRAGLGLNRHADDFFTGAGLVVRY